MQHRQAGLDIGGAEGVGSEVAAFRMPQVLPVLHEFARHLPSENVQGESLIGSLQCGLSSALEDLHCRFPKPDAVLRCIVRETLLAAACGIANIPRVTWAFEVHPRFVRKAAELDRIAVKHERDQQEMRLLVEVRDYLAEHPEAGLQCLLRALDSDPQLLKCVTKKAATQLQRRLAFALSHPEAYESGAQLRQPEDAHDLSASSLPARGGSALRRRIDDGATLQPINKTAALVTRPGPRV